MMKILIRFSIPCLLIILYTSSVYGQADNFEDGTTMNWRVGNAGTNPVNVSSDGPDGFDDNYLEFMSNGVEDGANGKLVIFNTSQWARNYVDDNITSISVDVNNFGSTALVLRLQIEAGANNRAVTNGINVSAMSGWQNISFDISPNSLTGSDPSGALQNANRLWLFHGATGTFPPDEIVARLGIDNFGANLISATSDIIQDASLVKLIQSVSQLDITWDNQLIGKISSLKVIDGSGKELISHGIEKNQNNKQLDVSNFSNGIYFVHLLGDEVNISKGIVK